MKKTTIGVIAFIAVVIVAALFFKRPPPEAKPDADAPKAAKADNPDESPRRPKAPTEDEPEDTGAFEVAGRVLVVGTDEPIAGALVVLRSHDDDESDPQTVVTDAQGGFSFPDVGRGRHALSATAKGYLPFVRRTLEVGDSAKMLLAVHLEAGGLRVFGDITDITGGTVEGALVRAVPQSGYVALRDLDAFGTVTNEDGKYELQVRPGRYTLHVTQPDYASAKRAIELSTGESEQSFALVPTGTIAGTVVTEDGGKPVPGAAVTWSRSKVMYLPGGERESMPAGGGTITADDGGRFTIRGLQPGHVMLSARASGKASREAIGVTLAIAEQVDGLELPVTGAFDVAGRVVNRDDPETGIANASVSVDVGSADLVTARTDEGGNFVLPGVLPGSYTIGASANGYTPLFPGTAVQVDGKQDDVQLELEAGAKITGRVDPPTIAEVKLELSPDSMMMGGGFVVLAAAGGVTTQEDGEFEIGPVRPGKTALTARASDGRAGRVDVAVGPDGAKDVVISLEPRATLAGTVKTVSGDPVAGALVNFRPRRPDGASVSVMVNGRQMDGEAAATAVDGSFEVAGVEPGTYAVTVTDQYGDALPLQGASPTEVVVGQADQKGLALVVEAHDGRIDGTVVTADGDPVPDAWVTLQNLPDVGGTKEPDPEGDGPRAEMQMVIATGVTGSDRPPVLTDEDGHFEFTGLHAGKYEVAAESDGGGSRVQAEASPDATLTLELAPLGAVSGKVTLNGKPLKDYVVSVGSLRRTRIVDDAGQYTLERLDPGTYKVSVRGGGGTGSASVTVEPGQTATADLALEALATVKGKVVDEAGEPIVGAMVMIGEGGGEDGSISVEQHGDGEGLVTGEDGTFETRCGAGSRVLLVLSAKSPQPIVMKIFVAEPGQDLDLGTLEKGSMPAGLGSPGG